MVIAAQLRDWRTSRGAFERASAAAFAGGTALLFTASAAMTVRWCSSMAAMGEMPMPGGWTMSMAWMRMPGQTWARTTASFTGMWALMMIAMMLPSLAPTLWRYREAAAVTGGRRPDGLAALAGAAYFSVWTGIGLALFPLGVGLAEVEMQYQAVSRAVPIAAGLVVVLAGVFQLSAWRSYGRKIRSLAVAVPCRTQNRDRKGADWSRYGCDVSADVASACRFGLRLGLHCSFGCAGLTAILLVLGVMDLRAMAVVTAAITAERLAPNGDRMARVVGAVAVGAGLYLIARASGLA